MFSGAFVAAGSGRDRATRVGRDAYARTIADVARRFSLVRSDLRAGIHSILRLVTWILVPAAILLVSCQLLSEHESVKEASAARWREWGA